MLSLDQLLSTISNVFLSGSFLNTFMTVIWGFFGNYQKVALNQIKKSALSF